MSCCNEIQKDLGGSSIHYANDKTSASERGKSFELLLTKKLPSCRIKLDGGILPVSKQQKQCDYLFIICSPAKQFFFVELKGSSVNAEEGFNQLCDTIRRLKHSIDISDKNHITGIIIGGAYTQKMNRLKAKFQKDIGRLIHKTGPRYIHSLS